MRATVERDEHAGLGAGVQQLAAHRVLAHDAHERVFRQVAVEALPAAAVVRALVDVGPEVVHLVAGDGNVHGARVVRAHLDRIDLRALQIAGCNVGPVRAFVASDMQQSVVTADINRADLVG